MPRIPQTDLDRLKADIDLTALIRAKGIDLKPHGGADLIGRCPFHDDKTPSLVVTPSKGLWLCGAPHNQSYAEYSVMRS